MSGPIPDGSNTNLVRELRRQAGGASRSRLYDQNPMLDVDTSLPGHDLVA